MTNGSREARRVWIYLAASCAAWLIEAFLFSSLLKFTWWQVALLLVLYFALFGAVLLALVRHIGYPRDAHPSMEQWRLAIYGPMTSVVVGSFVSLPLIVCVKLLGKLI